MRWLWVAALIMMVGCNQSGDIDNCPSGDCSDDNGMTGTFWNLESTHIFIGGWSRQGRDGGGHRISIEKAWQKLDGLSGSFEQYRAEITTILKNAIIEE